MGQRVSWRMGPVCHPPLPPPAPSPQMCATIHRMRGSQAASPPSPSPKQVGSPRKSRSPCSMGGLCLTTSPPPPAPYPFRCNRPPPPLPPQSAFPTVCNRQDLPGRICYVLLTPHPPSHSSAGLPNPPPPGPPSQGKEAALSVLSTFAASLCPLVWARGPHFVGPCRPPCAPGGTSAGAGLCGTEGSVPFGRGPPVRDRRRPAVDWRRPAVLRCLDAFVLSS